jgi:hypothetical protein
MHGILSRDLQNEDYVRAALLPACEPTIKPFIDKQNAAQPLYKVGFCIAHL